MRIYIAVPCYNRKALAEIALDSLRETKGQNDVLAAYRDGGNEYDTGWLAKHADVAFDCQNVGIEAQRKRHLLDFWASDFDRLYFTDADTFHDPSWRSEGIRLQDKYDAPVCLYNTAAHALLQWNTIRDDPDEEVVHRHFAPGVSYLLTREHVRKVVERLDYIHNFDWNIPEILGYKFVTSRVSYLDHLGAGGVHSVIGHNYDEGDRALFPTQYLIKRRAELVRELTK